MPISITTPYNPITDTNMELVRAAYIEKLGEMTPEYQHQIGKGILVLALLLAECNNGMSAENAIKRAESFFAAAKITAKG